MLLNLFLMSGKRDDVASSFVECIGNTVALSNRPQIGVGRNNNLDLSTRSDIVQNVNQPVPQFDVRAILAKKDAIQIAHTPLSPNETTERTRVVPLAKTAVPLRDSVNDRFAEKWAELLTRVTFA